MKTLITLVFTVLFSTLCLAQNGIGYKAIIKDANGNVVANQSITLQFTVLQGVAQTLVYQETHQSTTDANGLISLSIGEGSPINGTFNTIDWASDATFLNTQINTGAGLVDIGTSQFKAVPYALHANSVGSSEFVSENDVTHTTHVSDNFVIGSNTLDSDAGYENTKRLFFNKTKGAFRAGGAGYWVAGTHYNNWNAWDDVNVGDYSFASGFDNKAPGSISTAMGHGTEASGAASTAMGKSSIASGDSSIAIGTNFTNNTSTTASGESSVAIGINATASGYRSMAIGQGTLASQGNSIAMGSNTTASEYYAIAIGRETTASGFSSTAMGQNTNSSGGNATAMGYGTTASGEDSIAMGQGTEASGAYSTSMGYDTWAKGETSTAMGYHTTASSYASLAIGRYNVGGGNTTSWIGTDPLFEVGNGTSSSARSNAFTILKNGDVKVGSAVVHSSDRRLKKDISPLAYGLETVLQLNPVQYNWINRTQDYKSLGLIAQEVQPVISEIVHEDTDETKTLSVSYTELIPVLIKAIQEQQEIIDKQAETINTQDFKINNQDSKISNQDSKINTLTAELDQLKTLDTRVKQLESLINTLNQ